MPWVQLVIRPDSIIRYWATGQVDVGRGYAAVHDSDALRSIPFRTNLFFSNGATMVRSEEMRALAGALISTSKEDVDLFEKLGGHFERIGSEWLAFCATTFQPGRLVAATSEELANFVEEFVDRFADYAPILYVPFVVESRYAAEYPELLRRVASWLRHQLTNAVEASDVVNEFSSVLRVDAAPVDEIAAGLRPVLEYSPRQTDAERREHAVLGLALEIERDPHLCELFSKDEPPEPEAVRLHPALWNTLQDVVGEFGWMKQWGFPSHHSPAVAEDFIVELHATVRRRRPSDVIREREQDKERLGWLHDSLRRRGALDKSDARLLADINYYNFLRTYRMEVLIKAENLATPLFDEIGRRWEASSLLDPGDVYFMLPPEIIEGLRTSKLPPNLADRRRDWALLTDSRGEDRLYVSDQFETFADSVLSVIDHRETARGGRSSLDEDFVGGKGAGLFRLRAAAPNVPPFFVVTTRAFDRAVLASPQAIEIARLLEDLPDDEASLVARSERLQALVAHAQPHPAILEAIMRAFDELGADIVAVRSSATIEDSASHSWAGRFHTELHVSREGLLTAVKSVWASLFSQRALLYARHVGADFARLRMAIVVQEMVAADVAGVVNTTLGHSARDVVEIEAALGVGEAVVGGTVTPDRFLVRVGDEVTIVHVDVHVQAQQLGAGGWKDVNPEKGGAAKLTESQVLHLAALGKHLETLYGSPLDIEWAMSGDKLQLVQARPQTDLGVPVDQVLGDFRPDGHVVLSGLRGKTASVWRGEALVLTDMRTGEVPTDRHVLVIHAATPAWDPIVFRAGALITNEGGATSHAIRVANERGIPAVVGTSVATQKLRSGDEVVVDTASDALRGRVLLRSRREGGS